MKCTRGARTPATAKKMLAALKVLKVEDHELVVFAWGDWIDKAGEPLFFKTGPRPTIEKIGRVWCTVNVVGHGLVTARPAAGVDGKGLIEIEWIEN